MPSDKPHTTILFDRGLFEWVEDFRFEHGLANRSAAIMRLPSWAKEQDPQPPALKEQVAARD